ncbi:MAG: response regulator [Bacteroidales bacterium]|nr:response regulator [Bacteroidales bacterium]
MKKILVIEDTQNVRENICEILESEDYEVFASENGKSGVEMSKNIQPDLVLCDIMMPGMDGYEVLTEMRKDVITSTVPFIFLTAKNTRENQRLGMELGADDYITKPFTVEDLLNSVATRLKRAEEFKEESEKKLNELTQNLGAPITQVISEPLRAILGFSKMLMTEYNSMEKFEMAEFNSLIYKAGMKLNTVVKKSFMFYQLQSLAYDNESLMKLKEEKTSDIKTLTENIANEIAINNKRQDDFMINIENANLKIPSKYYLEILHEIIENAIIFSPKRSVIHIIGGVEDGQYALTIRDEGMGMTKDQISHIGAFQKFNKDLNENSGVGLGLINTKSILNLFNGNMVIKSILGIETTVRITFPLA